MIRKDTERVDPPSGFFSSLLQRVEKSLSIEIIPNDRLSAVASVHHVI